MGPEFARTAESVEPEPAEGREHPERDHPADDEPDEVAAVAGRAEGEGRRVMAPTSVEAGGRAWTG